MKEAETFSKEQKSALLAVSEKLSSLLENDDDDDELKRIPNVNNFVSQMLMFHAFDGSSFKANPSKNGR